MKNDYYTKQEIDDLLVDLKKEMQSIKNDLQYDIGNETLSRRLGAKIQYEELDARLNSLYTKVKNLENSKNQER